MIKMQTFNIVFHKTIKTLLMQIYHSAGDISASFMARWPSYTEQSINHQGMFRVSGHTPL